MLVTKLATSFLNYNIKKFSLLWKIILPSHPILTSFPSNSSNFKPPNSSKHIFQHQRKNVVKYTRNTNYFYTKKDGDPLPCLNHIQVDGYPLEGVDCHDFIHINCYEGIINKCNICSLQQHICMLSTMSQPKLSHQCFWKGFSPLATTSKDSCPRNQSWDIHE